MKIENDDIRGLFRTPGLCQLCGKPCPQGTDPHHVLSRGAGGSDIRIGLLSVCRECHSTKVDSKKGTERCWKAIALRENATVDEIKSANYFIANQLHRLDSEYMILDKIEAWPATEKAKEIVIRDLREAKVIV